MAIKPIKINVYDLAKKFSQTLSNSSGALKVITPIIKDTSIKREIGLRIVDAIINRTRSGFDKRNKEFKEYKKSYIDSTIFKIYKGSDETVNLKLTGNMQASIDVVSTEANTITIYFDDKEEAKKADWHCNPKTNKRTNKKLPQRDFWGPPTSEEQIKIMENVIKEYNDFTLMAKMDIQNEMLTEVETPKEV